MSNEGKTETPVSTRNGANNDRVRLEKLNTLDLNSDPSVVVGVSLDGLANIVSGTQSYWESRSKFIPEKDQIVIWTDIGGTQTEGGYKHVPGIKIGDGKAYNIDLPFVCDHEVIRLEGMIEQHTGESLIHVSSNDRTKWDNKITVDEDIVNETLILRR